MLELIPIHTVFEARFSFPIQAIAWLAHRLYACLTEIKSFSIVFCATVFMDYLPAFLVQLMDHSLRGLRLNSSCRSLGALRCLSRPRVEITREQIKTKMQMV